MKIIEQIYKGSAVGAGIILSAAAIMITADVLKRWVTNKPMIGVYEFCEIMFLALTFLALSATQHTRRQISMDMLSNRMKGRARCMFKAITDLLSLVFFGMITWRTIKGLFLAYSIGQVTFGAIEIPYLVYLSFLGWGLMLTCVCSAVSMLRNLGWILRPVKNLETENMHFNAR